MLYADFLRGLYYSYENGSNTFFSLVWLASTGLHGAVFQEI
jgi:hypothetical protein